MNWRGHNDYDYDYDYQAHKQKIIDLETMMYNVSKKLSNAYVKLTDDIDRLTESYNQLNEALKHEYDKSHERFLRHIDDLLYQGYTHYHYTGKGKIDSQWCRENLKHKYHVYGRDLYFESEQDASWFILRWA